MNTKILWLVLLAFITSIYAGNENSKIDFTDSAKAIIVERSKPTFSIILQSNPTTGYSWLLRSYDANLIAPVSRKYYPSTDKKLVGAPGYEKWTFRVKSLGFIVPQATSITLIYAHLWDGEAVQSINFRVVTNYAD